MIVELSGSSMSVRSGDVCSSKVLIITPFLWSVLEFIQPRDSADVVWPGRTLHIPKPPGSGLH